MNKAQIREYMLSELTSRLNSVDVDTDHKLFPQVNLQLKELTAFDALTIVESCTRPDGSVNQRALFGKILIACLRVKDTGEKVFEDADRDTVLQGGISVLQPLGVEAMKLCGLDDESTKNAKKNSSPVVIDTSLIPLQPEWANAM